MATLDDTDLRIVAALRADGRLSMRALAEQLHISRASAYARVERLESSRVITGYTATIDPRRCGYGLSAYVLLKIAQHSWQAVGREVLSIPEVDHAALVSGEHDIMLLVRTRDAASLRDVVLTRLQGMPEVASTHTVLIFDELSPRNRPTSDGLPAGRRAPKIVCRMHPFVIKHPPRVAGATLGAERFEAQGKGSVD